MPWKRMGGDEQRMQFVARAVSGKEGMAGLCREFGVSRPTGYRWRRRYERGGSFTALRELSRRPHHSPRRTEAEKEQRVVALRQETGWGAKKLHVVLLIEQGIRLSYGRVCQVVRHIVCKGWKEERAAENS